MRTAIVAPKIRFAIVLPVVQVATTAILTYWADHVEGIALGGGGGSRFARVHLLVIALRQVWRGVNAPALPFSFAGYGGTAYRIFSLGLSELLYLAAAGLVWWFVGRYVDERTGGTGEKRGARVRVSAVLGMAWGLILFGITFAMIQVSLRIFPDASVFRNFLFLLRNRPEVILTQILFLLWSAALVTLNVAPLARYMRRKDMRVITSE